MLFYLFSFEFFYSSRDYSAKGEDDIEAILDICRPSVAIAPIKTSGSKNVIPASHCDASSTVTQVTLLNLTCDASHRLRARWRRKRWCITGSQFSGCIGRPLIGWVFRALGCNIFWSIKHKPSAQIWGANNLSPILLLTGTKFDHLISKLQTFGNLLNLSSGRFILSRYIVGAILPNISGRTREVVNFRRLVRV